MTITDVYYLAYCSCRNYLSPVFTRQKGQCKEEQVREILQTDLFNSGTVVRTEIYGRQDVSGDELCSYHANWIRREDRH